MTDTEIVLMVKNMAREMVANVKNGKYKGIFKSGTGDVIELWQDGDEYTDTLGHVYKKGDKRSKNYYTNGAVIVVRIS